MILMRIIETYLYHQIKNWSLDRDNFKKIHNAVDNNMDYDDEKVRSLISEKKAAGPSQSTITSNSREDTMR